jgi:hypothetical protein
LWDESSTQHYVSKGRHCAARVFTISSTINAKAMLQLDKSSYTLGNLPWHLKCSIRTGIWPGYNRDTAHN